MKKLLGLLGTITIAGSGMAGIIGNAPASAKKEINYLQTNNLKSLNRSKRQIFNSDFDNVIYGLTMLSPGAQLALRGIETPQVKEWIKNNPKKVIACASNALGGIIGGSAGGPASGAAGGIGGCASGVVNEYLTEYYNKLTLNERRQELLQMEYSPGIYVFPGYENKIERNSCSYFPNMKYKLTINSQTAYEIKLQKSHRTEENNFKNYLKIKFLSFTEAGNQRPVTEISRVAISNYIWTNWTTISNIIDSLEIGQLLLINISC